MASRLRFVVPQPGSRVKAASQGVTSNAAWNRGGGDWETALGAAGHMGRRDIAEVLLARGARLDVFAAAMLGQADIVRAIVEAFPAMREASGLMESRSSSMQRRAAPRHTRSPPSSRLTRSEH